MKGDSILIVDDEEGLRHGLENLFRRAEFTVHSAADFGSAAAIAAQHPVDAAIVDIRLRKGPSGIDLLHELKRLEPEVVVIIITGFGSIDTAVTSLKGGAADYFLKPIDNRKLLDAVRRNLELRALTRENRFLREELSRRSSPHELVTRDPALRALVEKADKVKDNAVTVLLTGESGTGKEVLARYIHFTSTRRDGQFVSINCAALSESLLLSELFGHELGAFTGAVERKRGKFELADGGTLFLDEIGDMSPDIQAKLLRVIEESSFERVGGVKRVHVDVRLIAATNKDLPALIRAGKFRDDLYYRIHVVSLHLPPLREREVDIPLLVEHFLAKYGERYGRGPVRVSPRTLAALAAHDWPGNVRELENVVNQMVLLGEEGVTGFGPPPRPCPGAQGAAEGTGAAAPDSPPAPPPDGPPGPLKPALARWTAQVERRLVAESLARNGGNKSRTARELGVTRKTLALKMARYGL